MIIYKIQNEVGKFSKGGMFPKWSKYGKVWNSIAFLKSHFTLVAEMGGYEKDFNRVLKIYKNCNILIIEENKTTRISVEDFIRENMYDKI